jgi:hypothetical protein
MTPEQSHKLFDFFLQKFKILLCVPDYNQILEITKPEWFSVEKQLPKLNDRVLVYNTHVALMCYGVAVYIGKGRFQADATMISNSLLFEKVSDINLKVSHWMPLPSSPDVNKKDNTPVVIYGIIEAHSKTSVQAFAIDGQTGEIIRRCISSNANFALSDLGFSEPFMDKWDSFSNEPHSTIKFNSSALEEYKKRYPDGFRLSWQGVAWRGNKSLVDLISTCQDTYNQIL